MMSPSSRCRARTHALHACVAITTAASVLAACGADTELESSRTSSDCSELDSDATLSFINAGGEETDAIQAGYADPFTERTGIEVEFDPPNELGRLQAEIESGDVTHDLFTTESTTLEQAVAEGLVDELDYDLMDLSPSMPDALHKYGFGWQYYSTIMAWREDALPPGESGPSTWAEFFDTERFPGRRALPDYPAFALPVALLADGVPPEDLYPLDVDRAFEYLAEHQDDITVWWEAGAQPPELLSNGELDYSVVWSGRVVSVADELDLGYTYDQGLLDLSYATIVKGAPHYCEALAFLEELSKPENQAKAAEVLPYTGSSKNADEYLPQDRLDWFPTTAENREKQVLSDASWWYENGPDVQTRWEEFRLTR